MHKSASRPALDAQDSYRSDISTAFDPFALDNMDQPVPSFKSFVRSVAPVPTLDGQKQAPEPVGRRSSSVYSTWNTRKRSSRWIRKDSSIAEFYLQTFSRSDTDLTSPRKDSQGYDILDPPLSPDAIYFTPRKASEPEPQLPMLLEPKTYTPEPSQRRPNFGKPSSSRSSIGEIPPVPPLPRSITPLAETSLYGTAATLATSPASLSPVTPTAFTFETSVETPFRTSCELPRSSEAEFFDIPLLPHEKPSSRHSKAPSQESATSATSSNASTVGRHTKRTQRQLQQDLDRSTSLKSHAISEDSDASSDSSFNKSPSRRASKLLSMVLDMYTAGWIDRNSTDSEELQTHLFAEDYRATLARHKLEPMAPSLDDIDSMPKPLFCHPASTTSLDKIHPTAGRIGTLLPPPPTSKSILPPFAQDLLSKHEDIAISTSLRQEFNNARERQASASDSRLDLQTAVPAYRIKSKDLSDYTQVFPHIKRPSPKSETGKRRIDSPRHNSPMRSSPIRSSPIRSSAGRNTPPSPPAQTPRNNLFNFENMLGLRKAMPREATEVEFDHNKPIARPKPDADHSRKIRNALAQAKKEKAAGAEGAAEIFNAIHRTGMPADREDPFGILSVPDVPPIPQKFEGDKGRGRQLSFGIGGKSRSSKSQKRRDSLKKRIRVVGELGDDIGRRDFAV